MSCTTHFLNMDGQSHTWRRHITYEETQPTTVSDIGELKHIRCHTVDVCDTCGAVRDTGDCLCDPADADRCAIRLAYFRSART